MQDVLGHSQRWEALGLFSFLALLLWPLTFLPQIPVTGVSVPNAVLVRGLQTRGTVRWVSLKHASDHCQAAVPVSRASAQNASLTQQ